MPSLVVSVQTQHALFTITSEKILINIYRKDKKQAVAEQCQAQGSAS